MKVGKISPDNSEKLLKKTVGSPRLSTFLAF